MRYLLLSVLFLSLTLGSSALHAQSKVRKVPAEKVRPESLLQSGPMVGYSEMREVKLWVQTAAPATVKFVYFDKNNPAKKFSTAEMTTEKKTAFVAQPVADEVQPGIRYEYELYLNGEKVTRPYPMEFQSQALWQYRTEPPAFKIAMGSCAYISDSLYDRPGRPYGGGYEVFTAIYAQRPDAMLWLGDNIYLREPDWNTRTGIHHRYTHTRSLPELQPLLASAHHYAIWDDHDFGPNDNDRGFWNKDETLDAFKLFWANPSYGVPGTGGKGITTKFQWADVEFFLLDDRYFRSPNNRKQSLSEADRTILGKEQFEWLIDALSTSPATFKVIAIGGQVLSPAAVYENYATFPAERQRLIETITKEKIKGVLFLDGDRHHTEMTVLKRDGTYPLYDFTISPLCSGAIPADTVRKEANPLRDEQTLVGERNFAVMEVSGTRKERIMKMSVFNTAGKELWSRTLKAADLK